MRGDFAGARFIHAQGICFQGWIRCFETGLDLFPIQGCDSRWRLAVSGPGKQRQGHGSA
jgi:hypothetical protein